MNRLPLPHGLRIIAECAGIDAALDLAMARGGSRFSIPQKAEGSLLAEIVGIDAARKIVQVHADVCITVPLAKRHLYFALRAAGDSQEVACVKLKTSRRTVQNWEAADEDQPHPDLFDQAS